MRRLRCSACEREDDPRLERGELGAGVRQRALRERLAPLDEIGLAFPFVRHQSLTGAERST